MISITAAKPRNYGGRAPTTSLVSHAALKQSAAGQAESQGVAFKVRT